MIKCILTNRQYQVASYVSDGFTNEHISKLLKIKPRTVERHITTLFESVRSSYPYFNQDKFSKRVKLSNMFKEGLLLINDPKW